MQITEKVLVINMKPTKRENQESMTNVHQEKHLRRRGIPTEVEKLDRWNRNNKQEQLSVGAKIYLHQWQSSIGN